MGSAGVLIAATLIGVLSSSPAASAATCSPNPVVCENAKAGNPPSQWDIAKAGDETLQGFATDMSVNAGDTVAFKVRAEHAYTIDIFRLGYYGGDGARKVQSIEGTFPAQNQTTECVTDSDTKIYDCGTWAESATWPVPSTAVSGVYFALLKRTDNGGVSHITFVVRDDASTSDVIYKTSDATWQAYNRYGGASFYNDGPNGKATKLSYNRPFGTREFNNGRDFLFSNEYPAIRFLERNGYDVSYTTDVDADRDGGLLQNHKVFLSVGHDEYWSGPQRTAVEAARDAGTSLMFLSGNEVYWKTRWEPSQDGTATGHRTLVCYKETWHNMKKDPTAEWTGTWRDPRFSPPSNGGRPENALTGTVFMANHDDLTLKVPAAQGKNRFWRNTSVAELDTGTTATLAPHTVGYESDEDVDNGFRPAGLIRLSTTTGETPEYLRDFGNTVSPGTTTHHMTLYRAASGALVFGAGTVQYAWGLDAEHDTSFDPEPADERMQQATVNLLADMEVQPATLMSSLVAASASDDTAGPTVSVTSPASGASVANGTVITVSGTATDSGGVVAGVEVSLDNGVTWHPASGTTNWSYSGAVTGSDAATIKVRAADDSANLGDVETRAVTLTGSTSLFGNRVPDNPTTPDGDATEVGIKLIPQTDGYVKGVRFYKGSGNTGTHTGNLWSANGDLLATGTFDDETASGWQTLVFPNPVAVTAGVTYVASYTAPNGHYAADQWAFSYGPHLAPPLTAPRGLEAGGNGVFGSAGQFPDNSFRDDNYYVDVLFDVGTATPPTVTALAPLPDASFVDTSAQPTATFSKAIDPATMAFTVTGSGGAAVAGSPAYDAATKTATFTPSATLPAGQEFTVSVTASDTNGNAMAGPRTWSFTTDPGSATVSTLFATDDAPATSGVDESASVSLGVKFTPDTDGSVIGVRFYKGESNTGTHTGSLWSASGSRLATATFVSESASGWQYVYFSEPVPVTAGTAYVVSYHAPRGDYALTGGYFTSEKTSGPLSAPAGNNGLYVYGSDAFPSNSWSSSNYWVDPLFVGMAAPSQPTVPAGAKTVFAASATPAYAGWNDSSGVELGMTFTSDVAGAVNGVRFYKGTENVGTHTATLWTASGQFLASGSFIGETGSGWQTMLFSTPVPITANTEYVVSYLAPNGHYALNSGGLSSPVVDAPLRTVTGGGGYMYGGGFPSNPSGSNYWVDVVFTPAD